VGNYKNGTRFSWEVTLKGKEERCYDNSVGKIERKRCFRAIPQVGRANSTWAVQSIIVRGLNGKDLIS